jgi:hypothetical protein
LYIWPTTTKEKEEMDSHAREYAGAIAGFRESAGWHDTNNTPAVGDFVSGLTKGRRWSGHVQTIDGSRMVVEVSGAWLIVSVEDITH